jgi:hypothetical protein
MLRLTPFKFRVRYSRGMDYVVADAFSRIFKGGQRKVLKARVRHRWNPSRLFTPISPGVRQIRHFVRP